MIIALVKTGDRPYPPGPPSRNSPWQLLLIGFCLVDGMALLFIPLGIYGSVLLTAALLLFLFLPLLFLVIRLSTKFGNLLYVALFLSLLSAGVSALYISHSIGFFLGIPVGKNVDLAQSGEFGNDRILVFRGVKILTDYVSSRSAISRAKSEPKRAKTIYFHVAPLVAASWKEGDPIHVWVACERMELPNCSWGSSVFFWGENLKNHSLYPYYKLSVQDAGKIYKFPISEHPTIFRPIADPEKKLVRAGMYGLSGLFFLNYSWFVCIFLGKFFGKRMEK
ncbi:hypothetical protein DLM76_10485 [Leptospira yasudae]|uniref:DUF4131 domain-containing protein n=1 Tax=Leptospira yasudae TaxID=2202201 RepID=A0ABX9M5X5_9LEPT|nr:hypothetical protein [Leptospira yasudae]MBW0433834.1 hypothetical protein [Leptospira yasudae]RHX80682.1 hypothetical protein DLM77_07285 [Leptospira yasudae]RHX94495.1 hypothetical protein DLM76_10485 [Leptospira yasudae]TGK24249.1 hypothetical protein EHQ05_15060 [Leptospira yasudae]TGM00861.1 hypothetical protein EHQ86_19965 [Leptospira yasudae]